jgi:hypothetical protein
MALVLSEAGVDIRLTIDDHFEVLESTFEDYERGRTVGWPKNPHVYSTRREDLLQFQVYERYCTPLRSARLAVELRGSARYGGLRARVRRNVPWPTHRRHKVERAARAAQARRRRGSGRQDKGTITCFNNIGLGIKVGAVVVRVMELIREQGPRRKIPI